MKSRLYSLAISQLYLKLVPNWVTGFVDAEGCFSIVIRKCIKSKIGYRVDASFQITLHIKDRAILEIIQKFFGEKGGISKQGKKGIQYRVTKIEDLINIIIPYFDKFPLITQKRADFELFKMVIEIMSHKEHLTIEGIYKIVAIKASMNKGLSNSLKKEFPNMIPVKRPSIVDQVIQDPNWLAGFTSGEGCFNINLHKSRTVKLGEGVTLSFIIVQHSRDIELIKSLIDFFKAGKIYKSREIIDFRISKFEDLTEKVIPFFDKHQIIGDKVKNFEVFKQIAELMRNKAHLTSEGLSEIKVLINRGRE